MSENVDKHNLPANDVAKLLLHIMQTKNPKTRYAPMPQTFLNWMMMNILPKRKMDQLIARKFGLVKNK